MPLPLYSDIKLVSLFSKKVLALVILVSANTCNDLITKKSAGVTKYLLFAVNDEVAYFLVSS